jgi:DNA (cytosine-5)-methyltransferase 1
MGSMFSGGGGWDAGARMLGIKPVFAIEYEPWIARWHARVFGEHVIEGDVATVDYRALGRKVGHVVILVSSPPCQATSLSGKRGATVRAQRGIERAPSDVCDPRVGIFTLDAVDAVTPHIVFVENNEGYEKSEAFKAITSGLRARGYEVDHRVLDAADYGVPSARRRLIIRASKGALPPWPQKVERVAGWWEAISDLVESMPVDKLAPWQQKGLADNPPPADAGPLLIAGGNPTRTRNGYRHAPHRRWRRPAPLDARARAHSGLP